MQKVRVVIVLKSRTIVLARNYINLGGLCLSFQVRSIKMLIFLLENGFIIPSLVGGSEFNHHTISFPIYYIPGNELCGGFGLYY